ETVIAVCFDGSGYGSDGAVWGGEFLVGDYRGFRRAANLRYVGMPGGERAIREPWRMALAHAVDAGCESRLVESPERRMVRALLDRNLNTPPTSSAGRLFDAVASLVGVRDRVNYEGQAAVELEGLAALVLPSGRYPFAITTGVVDTRPLIRAVMA